MQIRRIIVTDALFHVLLLYLRFLILTYSLHLYCWEHGPESYLVILILLCIDIIYFYSLHTTLYSTFAKTFSQFVPLLSICVCVCVRVVCVCVCAVCAHVCICVCMYTCACVVCVYVCACACVRVMCVMCVCGVCLYVCMCLCGVCV